MAAKIKDITAVSFKIFRVAALTRPVLPFAAASDISGISSVEIELSRVDGKNSIGKAIPFIIPNCERASSPEWGYFAKFFGTNMFSAVLRAVFRYLPEVIGTEICKIRLTIPNGGRILPLSAFNFFLSLSQIIPKSKNEKISAAVSPKSTAAEQAASPLSQNFLTKTTTSSILTACSKSCETAFGGTLRRAIKYPRRQEVIPIKGSDKGRILRAGTARISPIKRSAINSAPK